MHRLLWRRETAVFLGIWLFLMIGGRSRLLRDPGCLWHTVVGQRILTSHTFPTTDTFSFTQFGQPWIAHQWLGEVTMALLHAAGGLDALLLATATLLAGLYAWLAHRLLRAGMHWLLALLVIALALLVGGQHFLARPHIVTIVFMGCLMGKLCDFEAGRVSLARMWWLAPLFVLWTNIHGGMLGGLATMILAAGGWIAASLLGKESPVSNGRAAFLLAALCTVCGLTMLVNPYGWRVPEVWVSLTFSSVAPRYMVEHMPLWQSGAAGWSVVLFAVVYGLALYGTMPHWPRITWLIPLFWFLLSWRSVRHAPLFAVTATLAIAEMFPYLRRPQWIARWTTLQAQPAADAKLGCPALVIPAILFVVCLGLQMSSVSVPIFGRNWAHLDRTFLPVDLLPDLRNYEKERGPGTPVFNEMLFGGVLIYHTPGLQVFIDDRCELYGDAGLMKIIEAQELQPERIDEWARQYGFDRALTITGSSFDRWLRQASSWSLERETPAASWHRRDASQETAR